MWRSPLPPSVPLCGGSSDSCCCTALISDSPDLLINATVLFCFRPDSTVCGGLARKGRLCLL
ncbi:hypothetical protein A2U01_0069153 [Trifolium medium]|uniref:Uncharacterized protein n=1 Tax=Trifolium medium TaxID=97028 RepID=A0A392SGA7_9FABA|nr:hypothetical protein [Trifolium medium]